MFLVIVFVFCVGQSVLFVSDARTCDEQSVLFVSSNPIKDCKLKDKKLYGRVQIVDRQADFLAKIVERQPGSCGLWEIVERAPDFTVQFVESQPDFTIEFVEHQPGMP